MNHLLRVSVSVALLFVSACSTVPRSSSKQVALQEANRAFVNTFGKAHMEKYRPLVVREVWHVYGTCPTPMGGEPNAIIDKKSGAILNVWHTK